MRRTFIIPMLLACMLVLPLIVLAQPKPAQTPRPTAAPEPATAPQPEQGPKPASTPAPKAEAAPRVLLPEPPGQPVNIRVEFTITDQYGATAPSSKTMSLLLADATGGMVRSVGNVPGYGDVQLHVDAEVRMIDASKIRARVGLNYDLVDPKAASGERRSTVIRESLTTILENGKPQVVSQSADPLTDRKVTVEVKGTIVK